MNMNMNMKRIACGLVAASVGFSSLGFAQPGRHEGHGGHGGHGNAREAQHDVRDARRDLHDARKERHEARKEQRRDAREQRREERREARYYYNARGPEFRRGGRLPPELRDRHYVVSDWRGHHLNPPPRGYHWVQVGPDYVLVAIATGVILNLIISR